VGPVGLEPTTEGL